MAKKSKKTLKTRSPKRGESARRASARPPVRSLQKLRVGKAGVKSLTVVYKIRDEVVWRKALNGSVVVLDTRLQSGVYSIDGIAAKVWNKIDGKRSLKQLQTYTKSPAQTAQFLDELVRLKLIRVVKKIR